MSGSDPSSKNEKPSREMQQIHGKCDSYLVENKLGEGTFGKVVKCKNLTTEEIVAVKVLKPNKNSGKAEIKALKSIAQLDPDKNNLIRFYEAFNYKGYTCLVFEHLNESMYDFLVNRRLLPLHVSEIRVIAQQLLVALDALKSICIVHCDIKPDNIMLVNHRSQPFKVKLIDFGNAMQKSTLERVHLIQALGYRAPEVVLGLPLDEAVDMWALGCVLALIFIGSHMYPVQSEYHFIRVIVKLQGLPEEEILKRGSNVNNFFTFTEDSCWKLKTKAEYKKITGTKAVENNCIDKNIKTFDELPKLHPGLDDPVEEKDTQAFMSLLKRMLLVNPAKRITPSQALGHRFITMSHLSCKTKGPYVTLAHANMRESKLVEPAVEWFGTSSETLGTVSSATSSFDWQTEEDTEDEDVAPSSQVGRETTESQTDLTSQEETLPGTETTQRAVAALQQYRKLSIEKGRILIHVRPKMSAKEGSSDTTTNNQPVEPKKLVTNRMQTNPTRCEGIVTARVGSVSPKPALDASRTTTSSDNAFGIVNCCDISKAELKHKCFKRVQNFFCRICECCRGSE